jgi:hypothetical protein
MLFGHQNDDNNPQPPTATSDVQVGGTPSVNPLAVDPDTGVSLPVVPDTLEHSTAPDVPVLNQPHDTPTVDTPDPLNVPTPTDTSLPEEHDVLDQSTDDDLLHIKQQALGQLSPLVGHLEQSPEEKFRTTMMLIQSSDNQSLVKDAYAAAQQITDDKVRAQALLDIVNEINYFTQHQHED